MEQVIELDVRDVAPMHRFETIMGAYESLNVGASMRLIVDHDPSCMYYTLQATRGDDSFEFEYLEKGPIDWQVVVTKQKDVAPVY